MLCDPVFKVICDQTECDNSILLDAHHDNYEGWDLADDLKVLLEKAGWASLYDEDIHLCPVHKDDYKL